MELSFSPMYTKALDVGARSVEAVLSSETIDGHGEIVDQSTWRLDRFRANPVVLLMHDRYTVVGKAEDINVADGQLRAKIVFATTYRANEVFELFRAGAMRAFSVGFRPGRFAEDSLPSGKKVRRLLDCELFEVSAVSIPSNPDAVVRHKSLGLLPKSGMVAGDDPSADLVSLANEAVRLAGIPEAPRSAADAFNDWTPESLAPRSKVIAPKGVEVNSNDPSADLVSLALAASGAEPPEAA